MIQQIGLTRQTVQSVLKQSVETTDDKFKATLNNMSDAEEITFNKQGEKMKFGFRIEGAEFGDYFTEEQLQRWQQSAGDVDATHRALLQLVNDAQERENRPGSMSMRYYDFYYLLEQGQVVNQQNAGFTDEIMKSRNWDYSVMLTEIFDVQHVESNKQQLNIMRAVMDLGMVSKDRGLMSSEDVRELLAKKKFEEQQMLLERAFEKSIYYKINWKRKNSNEGTKRFGSSSAFFSCQSVVWVHYVLIIVNLRFYLFQ